MDEKLDWGKLNIGDAGHPLEYEITDELIDKYAKATGNYYPWHFKASPCGPRVAHTPINAPDYFTSIFLGWGHEWTGLHARHETQVSALLKPRQKVRVTGRVVDKCRKTEKQLP